MSKSLEIAQRQLLSPVGMEQNDIDRTLGQLCTRNIDQADLYFECTRSESWILEDGIVKEGSHSIDQGIGVRAISGEKTGFAYSDEILLPALNQAATTARAITRSGANKQLNISPQPGVPALYTGEDPVLSISTEQKLTLLRSIDRRTREKDSRVKQVIATLSGQHSTMLVAGIDGTYTADIRPLVRLNVSVIVEENGRLEKGSSGGGGRFGYEYSLNPASQMSTSTRR